MSDCIHPRPPTAVDSLLLTRHALYHPLHALPHTRSPTILPLFLPWIHHHKCCLIIALLASRLFFPSSLFPPLYLSPRRLASSLNLPDMYPSILVDILEGRVERAFSLHSCLSAPPARFRDCPRFALCLASTAPIPCTVPTPLRLVLPQAVFLSTFVCHTCTTPCKRPELPRPAHHARACACAPRSL